MRAEDVVSQRGRGRRAVACLRHILQLVVFARLHPVGVVHIIAGVQRSLEHQSLLREPLALRCDAPEVVVDHGERVGAVATALPLPYCCVHDTRR